MKKIVNILVLGVIIFAFIFCSKQEIEKWEDNIKLSTKLVEFNAGENFTTVTTGTNSWWIHEIALNGNPINLQQINLMDQNFIMETPEFRVERINGNVIKIKMNANSTNMERTLIIGLQNGDYFDGVKIKQNAK